MDLGLLFVATFGLIALEVPIAFALIAGSLLYFLTSSPLPVGIVVQRMAPGIDSFPLLAIPLFVLAGSILNSGGIAARIFEFAAALVGHIRGGLAHVNVVASLIFAGMSGVAQADAAGLGTVEIRAMRREGFDPAFAAAVSASSAIVGPIIPPSVIMVVYGVLAQVSVGDLFLAGIIPGFVIGLLLMITIVVLVQTKRVYAPVRPRVTLRGLGRGFLRAIAPLLAPVLLCAGLLLGVATPTELGALTVVYATALGFLYRELSLLKLLRCLSDTLVTSGVLIFIMSAAVPFGWIISINNVPAELSALILGWTTNPVCNSPHCGASPSATYPPARNQPGALWVGCDPEPPHRRDNAPVWCSAVHRAAYRSGKFRSNGPRDATLLRASSNCACDHHIRARSFVVASKVR
jgi:tripartite ATP-independent transporter DctM subunit